MKNGFDEKVKGHGFFRKTKAFGLASGIALGAALLIGANTVSADEATPAQPTTTAQPTSSDAKTEVVTVKEAELKAKVDEAKKAGVEVTEKPAVSVGTATNDADAKKLEAEANEKVNVQIKNLEDAKKQATELKANKDQIDAFKNSLLSSPELDFTLINSLYYEQAKSQSSNGVNTATNFKSSKGEVTFLKAGSVGAPGITEYAEAAQADELLDKGTTNTPSLVQLYKQIQHTARPLPADATSFDKGTVFVDSKMEGKTTPHYGVVLTSGETVTYDYNFDKNSELVKNYGVYGVRRSITLKGNPFTNDNGKAVNYVSPYLGSQENMWLYTHKKQAQYKVGSEYSFIVQTEFLDANGNVMPLNKALASIANGLFFGSQNVMTESDMAKRADLPTYNAEPAKNKIIEWTGEKVSRTDKAVNDEFVFRVHSQAPEENSTWGTNMEISAANANDQHSKGNLENYNKKATATVTPITYSRATTITTTYTPNSKLNPGEIKVIDDGKQSGKKVIEVGTKPSEKIEEIPFKEETRPNPQLPEGERKVVQEGVKGRKVTRTTYTFDANTGKVTPKEEVVENTEPKNRIVEVGTKKLNTEKPDSVTEGELVTVYRPNDKLESGKQNEVEPGKKSKLVNGKETEAGKPRIIEVGTKPVVVEKEIPFKETVVQNPSKPEGTRTVLKEGKVGKETTTTTYTLDTKTGKVTPDTKTTVVKAEDRLVEVGSGKNVTGDVETQYVPDPELEPGQSKVVQEGTPEVKDVTGKVLTPGKPTIIHIGTKPKVVEEELPFKEEVRENKDLPKGERKVVQEGKVGKKVTTTTYTLDTKTGKVTSEDKVEETAAVNKIIEVGTKEEVKATPAPQSPAAPKAQLPHTGTEASLALTLAGLAVAGIATTMVRKKKEQ